MVPRIWRISAALFIAAVALVLVAAYTVVASADTDNAAVSPTEVAAPAADEDPDTAEAPAATDGQKAAADDASDEKAGQPEGNATADSDGDATAPDNGPSNGGAVPDDEKKPADDPAAQKPSSDEESTERILRLTTELRMRRSLRPRAIPEAVRAPMPSRRLRLKILPSRRNPRISPTPPLLKNLEMNRRTRTGPAGARSGAKRPMTSTKVRACPRHGISIMPFRHGRRRETSTCGAAFRPLGRCGCLK